MMAAVLLHLLLAAAAVTGVWLWQLRWKNAGIVDATWAFIIGLGAVLYAALARGDPALRALTAGLAGLWALRLGGYLIVRNAGRPEERRYAELRARWGSQANARMLGFFLLQAAIAWAIALTFVPVTMRAERPPAGWLALGMALGLVGIVGEAIADFQLYRFKQDARNRGLVFDRGLWRYSRHPNFFFECVYWLTYPCLAYGAPRGWLSLIGPAVIALLLLKVSGVPTVESREASRRRAGYDDYVRRTSAFLPLPPKRT